MLFSDNRQLFEIRYSGLSGSREFRKHSFPWMILSQRPLIACTTCSYIAVNVHLSDYKSHSFFRFMKESERSSQYLTVDEQDSLVKHNELALKAFCKSFSPPMPPNVMVNQQQ